MVPGKVILNLNLQKGGFVKAAVAPAGREKTGGGTSQRDIKNKVEKDCWTSPAMVWNVDKNLFLLGGQKYHYEHKTVV